MMDDLDLSRSAKRARTELLDAARRALANEDARRLFRWVLDKTGLFEQGFTGNSSTFFNEGKREIGLELVALLNEIDPYEFVRLMKEGADDVVRKRNLERKDERDDV